jgi:hypothetical protein
MKSKLSKIFIAVACMFPLTAMSETSKEPIQPIKAAKPANPKLVSLGQNVNFSAKMHQIS